MPDTNATPPRAEGRPLTGRMVLLILVSAFGIILAANLTLAFSAIGTFPGVETKNSYVVSQNFDADRSAQLALGWDVRATVQDDQLRLSIKDRYGNAVQPELTSATLGRATHVQDDQTPDFIWQGGAFIAPVDLAPGNWNLRLTAVAEDGTDFRQRIVIIVPRG
jgi:nitrogen fixation protein FixH